MRTIVRQDGESVRLSQNGKLCYIDDGGRPAEIAMQVEISNHPKVLWTKAMVLSVGEKAVRTVR